MPAPSLGGGGIVVPPYTLVFLNWEHERRRMRRQLRAVWRGASREDIDDAIEAAVELLLVKALEFHSAEAALGSLYASAVFCLSNERRKNKRHSITDLDEARELPADGTIERSRKQELLDLALKGLSEQDQEMLHAIYVEGYSITDYARTHGLKYEQVKKRQQRDLKKLKDALRKRK